MDKINFDDRGLYIPFVQLAWAASFFVNLVGCAVQIAAMRDILLLKSSRTASDVIIMSLMGAGLAFSSTCGFQCIVNGVAGVFASGKLACFFEAYFHSVTFTAVILAHVLFATHCYLGIVHRKSLTVCQITTIVVISDCILLVGTASLAHFESLAPIFLSKGGLYCFFDFKAPFTMFYWVPLFCLSFAAIAVLYSLIYRHTAESSEQVTRGSVSRSSLLPRSNTSRRLAKRATYLLSTLLAFLPMLVALCMTWFNQEPPALFVAFAGVCADFHGIAGPVVYAIQNPRLHTFSRIPCLAKFHSRERASSYSVNPNASISRFQPQRGTFLATKSPSLCVTPIARRDTMPFDPALFRVEQCSDTKSSAGSRLDTSSNPPSSPQSEPTVSLAYSPPSLILSRDSEGDSELCTLPSAALAPTTALVLVDFEQDLDLLPEVSDEEVVDSIPTIGPI